MSDGTIIHGGPHGKRRPLPRASDQERAAVVVILRDNQLELPLQSQISSLVDAEVVARLRLGNHDVDSIDRQDQRSASEPTVKFHGSWGNLTGFTSHMFASACENGGYLGPELLEDLAYALRTWGYDDVTAA